MTQKLTEEELRAILTDADERVPIASRIKHRGNGHVYHVMSIALRELDLAPLISYRREDSSVTFSRPLPEVLERFTLVTAPGGKVRDWF